MKLDDTERAVPLGQLTHAQIEYLALGLYAEWKGSNDPEERQEIVTQAYAMTPGDERRAALRFLKLREKHLGGGGE